MRIDRCMNCMGETSQEPCPYCGFTREGYTQESYVMPMEIILAGRYLVGRRLGQGGFGITYVGWDLALNRKVAIKEYFPSGQVTRHPGTGLNLLWNDGAQANMLRREGMESFLKEARKMMKADTVPSVVRVLNTFQENNTAYIIMEFVEGETLKARLDRVGPIPWKTAKDIFIPAVSTLAQVHAVGIIHRDISPDNLMLQPDGQVRILDLGAAKDISVNTGASSALVIKGGFSPLEQYAQRGSSGPWTDVYAMAATIYYTVSGVLPPASVDRVTKDSIRWDIPGIKELPKNVRIGLQNALIVSSKQRTQTMQELLEALGGSKRQIRIHTEDLFQQKKRKKRKIVGLTIAGTAAALAIAAGTILLPRFMSQNTSVEEVTEPTTVATEETIPTTEPTPQPSRLAQSVVHSEDAFGTGIERNQVTSLTFTDTFEDSPDQTTDLSEAQDGSIQAWYKNNGNITIAAESTIILPEDCSNLFADFSNLQQLSMNEQLDTSSVTDMSGMFDGCSKLTSLEMSSWDTSSVTTMENMFRGCEKLKNASVEGFQTGKVTDMSGMFQNCAALELSSLAQWDTSSVTDMEEMFYDCQTSDEMSIDSFQVEQVEHYDNFMIAGCKVSGKSWRTLFEGTEGLKPETKDTDYVFGSNYTRSSVVSITFLDTVADAPEDAEDVSIAEDGSVLLWGEETRWPKGQYNIYIASDGGVIAPKNCDALLADYPQVTEMDLSALNTGNTKSMNGMFADCAELKELSVQTLSTSGVKDMHGMFSGCTALKKLSLSQWDTSSVTDMGEMFAKCSALTTLDMSGLDSSAVTDMSEMFYLCSSLTNLNIDGLDADSVTDMSGMFTFCSSLKTVDLSGMNTSQVTDMSELFSNCKALSTLTLTGLNTSGVVNMSAMFNNCVSLESLDVSSFQTDNVTDMSKLFFNCSGLKQLDVQSLNTSNVTNMSCMFFGCSRLEALDLSGLQTAKVTNMSNMFGSCSTLTELDLSSFDTSSVTDMSGMFVSCTYLKTVDISSFNTSAVTDMRRMFRGCNNLYTLDLTNFDVSNVTQYDEFMSTGRYVNGKPWTDIFA